MFRGVARSNAKDERLFALAEVRDLTPVHDDRRPRGRPAGARTGAGFRAGGDPRLPGAPATAPSLDVEPRRPPRVAGHRAASRRDPGPGRAHGAEDDRTRARAGRDTGTTSRSGWRRPRPARCASSSRPGTTSRSRWRTRRPSRSGRSTRERDGSAQRVAAAPCIPRRSSSCSRPRGPIHTAGQPAGEFIEHELTRRWPARAGRPSAGDEPERHRRRHRPELHGPLPGGNAARDPPRRPDPRARIAGRAGVPANRRGDRPRRRARRPAGMVRAVGRSQDRDGLGDRDDGLDRRRAASDRAVHAGRRRAERGGVRDQRRGSAVLQRRGDDADAHSRRADHDPGKLDAARGQAVARLLRRRVGRGQPGHRRLRADHGAQRSGAVLGQRPRGRVRPAAPLLRAHLRGSRRALSAPRRHIGSGRSRRRARLRTTLPARRCGGSATCSPSR